MVDYENCTEIERLKAIDKLLQDKRLSAQFIPKRTEKLSSNVSRNHYTVTIVKDKEYFSFPYFCAVQTTESGKPKPSELENPDPELALQRIDRERYGAISKMRISCYVGFFYCTALDYSYLEIEGVEDLADYIHMSDCKTAEDIREAQKSYLSLIENNKNLRKLFGEDGVNQLQEITYGY